jgi:methyl-accepting chemotaxis protein
MNGDIGAGNRHPICQRAVAAIQDVANVIGEIDQISTAIALAIGEQGSATMEISRSVKGAAQGTREVSSNISGVQKAADESGATARSRSAQQTAAGV